MSRKINNEKDDCRDPEEAQKRKSYSGKFADLHLHTNFSDGTYPPEILVKVAGKAGLSCIAVVDHDTVSGVAIAQEASRSSGIEVLAGIEMSSEYEGLEIHILGYLIDCQNKNLLERLEILKINRIERIYKIADKLKGLGVQLEAEGIFKIAGGGTVGRLHVARAMVKEGLVSSIGEAFYKYIGDKCPAYVLGFKLSPAEAITLIKDAGGIPVLAHPYTIGNDDIILKIIEGGIMGLEAYYPKHSQGMVNFYLDLAKKYSLLVTGGSDCHGEAKSEAKIGSIKIPYELVEGLKRAK